MDALSSHIAVLDRHGVILAVNKAWRRFATANRYQGRDYGIGSNYLDECAAASGACVDARAVGDGLRSVLSGATETFEHEYPCDSPGERRWFLLRATRFVTPHPGDGHVVVAHENITARRLAEERLRQREQQLRLVTDALPVLISYVDAQERYQFNNKAYEAWFGVKTDDLRGRPLREVLGDTAYERLRPSIRRALGGESFSFESEVDYAVVGRRVVRATYVPDRDPQGHVRGYYALVTDETARARTEAALVRSERRYRALFESIDQGFCVAQMIFDDAGVPVDYRIIEGNAAFKQMTGIVDVSGEKTVYEMLPDLERRWCNVYGEVALSGQPKRFEDYAAPMDKWFEVYAFAFGEPGSGQVAIFFKDVNARVRNEARDQFLLRLDDALRSLADPREVMCSACRLLGEHLGVERCAYADVEPDEAHFNLRDDWTRGVPSIIGRFSFAAFGQACLDAMRAGVPLVIDDSERDPRCREALEGFRAIQARSMIGVPLRQRGRFVAGLAVHHVVPRRWRADEVDLVERVALRCWESIERARVAQALRDSEERYRAFIAQSSEGIWRIEFDPPVDTRLSVDDQIEQAYARARIAECNEVMARMYSVASVDEFVGLPLDAMLPRHDPRVMEYLRSIVQAGYRVSDAVSVERDARGREVHFANSMSGIIENGLLVRLWGTQRDITARQQAEAAARESATRLHLAQEAGELGIHDWNMLTGSIQWDARTRELWGAEADKPITFELFDRSLHPDDRTVVAEAIARASDPDGDGRYFAEYRVTNRRDGRERWILATGLVTFVQRVPARLVGTVQDVTLRKQSEAALARARDELEDRVRERTAELEATHQRLRLSERMAALGTLSAGLGHDMGNLLVPLRVRLDSLEAGGLSPAGREDVQAIRASADYLRNLAAGLRMLALDPQRAGRDEPTELLAWWRDAEPMLRNILPRGVALRGELPSTPASAVISRPALTQAVFNLVQNAGDALRLAASGTVLVRVRPEGERVLVEVHDDGPGMPPDVQARCMEPFFTTKPRERSTGLGLALVYGLVREAGGSVTLRSEAGRGTTFTLALRRVAPQAAVEGGAPRTARVEVRDARLRALISAELRSLGLLVTTDAPGATPVVSVIDDAKRVDAAEPGAVILLGMLEGDSSGRAGVRDRVVALGAHPPLHELRAALRRVAGGGAS